MVGGRLCFWGVVVPLIRDLDLAAVWESNIDNAEGVSSPRC